jgi:hypothetical protein
MAHAWKACWVQALMGSNPIFSAEIAKTPSIQRFGGVLSHLKSQDGVERWRRKQYTRTKGVVMASSDKRAAYGKGGLYKRSVFEKDERGKVVLDRRGNPVVKYDYWQATFEIPAEDLPDGVRRRRLTGNATNKSAALAALRENIDAFYERKRNGEPTYRTPRKRGAKRYTIDDLFTLWLQRKTDEALRPTVIRKYRRMYEQHISQRLARSSWTK